MSFLHDVGLYDSWTIFDLMIEDCICTSFYYHNQKSNRTYGSGSGRESVLLIECGLFSITRGCFTGVNAFLYPRVSKQPEYIYKWVWVIYLFSIFRLDSAILEQSYNRSKSKHVSILHDRLVPIKTQQFLNRVQNFLCTVSLYRLCMWVSFRFLRH